MTKELTKSVYIREQLQVTCLGETVLRLMKMISCWVKYVSSFWYYHAMTPLMNNNHNDLHIL